MSDDRSISGDGGGGRRDLLRWCAALVAAPLLQPGRALAASPPVDPTPFTPERFGAVGDGVTDDTIAFQKLSRIVSERGGGTIVLRRGATYRVGRQVAAGATAGPAFAAQPMLMLTGVDGVAVLGNGATIKLNDGLRYGSFDPVTGQRFDPPKGKFTNPRFAASVGHIIDIRSSRNVRVENVTLDGNMDKLIVGGRWSVGIQLRAVGLSMTEVGEVVVENVTCRNNGLDGVYLRGRGLAKAGSPSDRIRFRDVRCDRNGRQGLSIIGGRGLTFERCSFSNTSQGPVGSDPGAGVDIEPNGRDWTTEIVFDGCTFTNNRGVGLLADQAGSHSITARDCTFWQGFDARPGTTKGSGDAFWFRKEGVLVERCRVHGTVTNLPPSARVVDCAFDDAVHPSLGRSAQRRQYLIANAKGQFIGCGFSVAGSANKGLIYAVGATLFRRCRFRFAGTGLSKDRAAAFFGPGTVLQDVTFSEALPGREAGGHYIYSRATLRGRVVISGPVVRWGNRGGPVGVIPPSASAAPTK